MNKLIIHFIFLLFIGCSSPIHKVIDYKILIGEWKLESDTQVNYPLIEFRADSTAIFSSRGDTLYRYNFILKGDTLLLKDIFNNELINTINFLNNKQLIFDKLLEHETKQTYTKVIYP